ncbi:C40 family peptidase [Kineothrix sp. MB12-C1]|uniref:C40 family peptidase n=1 Tax=Kineothrix sp. MB12-C1 TaxID=3070215 RepID=UPI0027D23620|nr:C40 family peptidase [Kineothrix sp. MB12-C1]WMC92954.1 NlpC/P60 family protein [Kineothrix sp. MB12-C1]
MKYQLAGVAGMCITGLILLQNLPVYAVENQGVLEKFLAPAQAETVLDTASLVGNEAVMPVVSNIRMDSIKESIAQPIGAATLLESEKTRVEYIETASEAEGSLWGYTNLGISNVDNNLNIRQTAAEDGKLVGKLPRNAACEIIERDGEWALVRSGKVEGYVKGEFLLDGWNAKKRANEAMAVVAVVNTDSLKVREEPNTDSEVVTMVPKGEELDVVEMNGDWVKILIDDEENYIASEYVKIEEKLGTAITMTELLYGQGVSDIRVDLCQYAKQFVGNPYVWGGTSLTKGADCSGFVLSVFKNFGISLPRNSGSQAGAGTKITMSQAQPGDLIFYAKGGNINHVAIYIGGGQVVHASSPKTGIKISTYNYRTPAKVVRVLPRD